MIPDGRLYGVILDMDGVLVDSEPFIQEAFIRMYAEKGLVVTKEDFAPFVGTGEGRFVQAMGERFGIPIDVARDKARTYAIYAEMVRGQLKALPGVYSFIDECRSRKLKLAVASSADAVKVRANLQELGLEADSFDAVLNGNDVTRTKPAPDVFLKAAERIGLPAGECLVVEDAIAGVAAAKSAGARCLALTTSFPADRLTAADWIAPTLAEVPKPVWAKLMG